MFIYNKMQKTSSDRAAAGAARRNQRGICHKRTQGGEPQAKELNHGFAEIAVHAKVTKEMLHKSLSLRSLRWLWLESFWIWMIRRYCGAGGPPQPKQEFATGQHRWAQTWENLASRLFLLVAGRGKPMICAQTKAKNMGGIRGIGQKRQTQPDLGPAGLAKETLLNRCDPHGGQGNGLRYLTLS